MIRSLLVLTCLLYTGYLIPQAVRKARADYHLYRVMEVSTSDEDRATYGETK